MRYLGHRPRTIRFNMRPRRAPVVHARRLQWVLALLGTLVITFSFWQIGLAAICAIWHVCR